MKKLELYIHIPFCVAKCAYCDFLSFPADEKMQEKYFDALIRDKIRMWMDSERTAGRQFLKALSQQMVDF